MNEQKEIANKIQHIFSLCGEMILYIPLLEEHLQSISNEQTITESLYPVLLAQGKSLKEIRQLQKSLRRSEMRTEVFLKFLKTLRDTELEKLQEGKLS